MTGFLGRTAYETYAQKMREQMLPTVPWSRIGHWRQEAWQEVGETIAKHCGVDPVVFADAERRKVGSTEEPREASEGSGNEPA